MLYLGENEIYVPSMLAVEKENQNISYVIMKLKTYLFVCHFS